MKTKLTLREELAFRLLLNDKFSHFSYDRTVYKANHKVYKNMMKRALEASDLIIKEFSLNATYLKKLTDE